MSFLIKCIGESVHLASRAILLRYTPFSLSGVIDQINEIDVLTLLSIVCNMKFGICNL